MAHVLTPPSYEVAAAELAAATAEGVRVRARGGATKLGWGIPTEEPQVEISTSALDGVIEHNAGDLTAVVQAGVPLARLQEQLAAAGQMLALDPPLGEPATSATLGGVFSAADSGPLRHRYGGPRDLVLGMTVALSDGTVARSGGKVIKNVAGYDLAKLFTGSLGTLGLILDLSVRLHPLPAARATTLGATGDPARLGAAACAVAREPLELEALDVGWRGGRGGLAARCAGTAAARRGERVARLMGELGLEGIDVVHSDASLWGRQRSGQRARAGALVLVAARPSRLPEVLRAVDAAGGTLVGRAGLGIGYIDLDPGDVARLRAGLGGAASSVILEGPDELRAGPGAWGTGGGDAELALMRQVKCRFDPAGTCNPGVFVGGI